MKPDTMMQFPDGYPELLEQIGQVIYTRLVTHEIAQAKSLTFAITEAIRTELGGVQQYIPRGLPYEISQRDKQIWSEFNGDNYRAIAYKYNLTEMQVRNIVKRARQLNTSTRQRSLLPHGNQSSLIASRGRDRHHGGMKNSRSLDDLLPPVRTRAQAFLIACKREGIDILVTSTYRDLESQAALYAQGRTAPGKRVTNAKPGQSYHNWRVAFDVVPLRDGKPVWNTTGTDGKLWERIGQLGEAAGLEWAGRWKTFRDYPHFQYTGGLSLAQLAAGMAPQEVASV